MLRDSYQYYLQSYFFRLVLINPKRSDNKSNVGLTIIINDIPNPKKNEFKLNGKDIVQEIAFIINPIGNNSIANKQILVKFNFQIINYFSC